ncbi:hypothetical protein F511_02142 [Dorcoceras hygrometricum]|uniref:Uncharacterized protein n=1 Tax=Dorcoceras hygrometricum TaxID=472368 RepID=A0A2Z7DGE3_9LAMI|nr:hypothetical protein F511_02142 [Dorcoceras hygrometricum]
MSSSKICPVDGLKRQSSQLVCWNDKNQLQALEEEDGPAGTSKGNQLEHLSGPSMMMTTSCSADEERSAGARRPAGELSDDEVSSDISNQQRATVQPAVGSYSTSRRKQQNIQSIATMNQLLLCIQSQDEVPVASYSGSSRRLQRVATSRQRIQSRATVDPVACYSDIAYQSTWNPDARKAEVAKNCNQAQSIQSSKNPVAAVK